MVWNGTEILVRNMEDARMEWNRRLQEWNGKHLPYYHGNFLLDFAHGIYKKMIVIHKSVLPKCLCNSLPKIALIRSYVLRKQCTVQRYCVIALCS